MEQPAETGPNRLLEESSLGDGLEPPVCFTNSIKIFTAPESFFCQQKLRAVIVLKEIHQLPTRSEVLKT